MNIINRPDVEDKADDAEGSPEGWAVVTDDIAGGGPESTGPVTQGPAISKKSRSWKARKPGSELAASRP
jgi:hypothetical protein